MKYSYCVWEYLVVAGIATIAYVIGYRKGHLDCWLGINKWRTKAVPSMREWKEKHCHTTKEDEGGGGVDE